MTRKPRFAGSSPLAVWPGGRIGIVLVCPVVAFGLSVTLNVPPGGVPGAESWAHGFGSGVPGLATIW